MSKFKKPNVELSNLLDEAVEAFPTNKRKMFGSPVYFVNIQISCTSGTNY